MFRKLNYICNYGEFLLKQKKIEIKLFFFSYFILHFVDIFISPNSLYSPTIIANLRKRGSGLVHGEMLLKSIILKKKELLWLIAAKQLNVHIVFAHHCKWQKDLQLLWNNKYLIMHIYLQNIKTNIFLCKLHVYYYKFLVIADYTKVLCCL